MRWFEGARESRFCFSPWPHLSWGPKLQRIMEEESIFFIITCAGVKAIYSENSDKKLDRSDGLWDLETIVHFRPEPNFSTNWVVRDQGEGIQTPEVIGEMVTPGSHILMHSDLATGRVLSDIWPSISCLVGDLGIELGEWSLWASLGYSGAETAPAWGSCLQCWACYVYWGSRCSPREVFHRWQGTAPLTCHPDNLFFFKKTNSTDYCCYIERLGISFSSLICLEVFTSL